MNWKILNCIFIDIHIIIFWGQKTNSNSELKLFHSPLFNHHSRLNSHDSEWSPWSWALPRLSRWPTGRSKVTRCEGPTQRRFACNSIFHLGNSNITHPRRRIPFFKYWPEFWYSISPLCPLFVWETKTSQFFGRTFFGNFFLEWCCHFGVSGIFMMKISSRKYMYIYVFTRSLDCLRLPVASNRRVPETTRGYQEAP